MDVHPTAIDGVKLLVRGLAFDDTHLAIDRPFEAGAITVLPDWRAALEPVLDEVFRPALRQSPEAVA